MPGHERIDLRLGFRRENGMDIYLFCKNVTDQHIARYGDVTDDDANHGAYLAQFGSPASSVWASRSGAIESMA